MANTCYFCQAREAIKQIELGDGEVIWTCGVCWDGFISDALSGIPASDTVEAGPNPAPTETQNPLPEHR
jgi:hypothetical protein